MGILEMPIRICYNADRQKDTSVQGGTAPPEVATLGAFYPVMGGWFNPKVGYQLFVSVQPFADVVGDYTC